LAERIDLRFAEFKRQTHTYFVDLINAKDSSEEEVLEEGEEEGVDNAILDGEEQEGERVRVTFQLDFLCTGFLP
jgi:hypothetical protein